MKLMCYMYGVIAGRIFPRVLKCVFFGMTAFSVASAGDAVSDEVSPQAYPFDLKQVQLLEGPFKQAQELHRRYMLAHDMDILMYPFRREAGLPTPVKGSDSQIYAYTGSHLGHYLSACALMVRNTGDAELKKRADDAVALLAECQKRIGTGFVMGFPEHKMKEFISTGQTGRAMDSPKNITVPWYSLHKVYAGLLDMYVLTGNRQALEVLQKSVDWLWDQIGQLPEKKMKVLMLNEIGGMSELLANLYAVTRQGEYLILSKRFQENDLMAAFARGEDPLDDRHANSRIPRFTGTVRQYVLTGDPELLTIATNFWNVVTKERSYVTGGNSSGEKFSPKADLSQYIYNNTCETCNSYNMLKLTRSLFCVEPRAAYADYYERTLYNHIRASQNRETGGLLVSHQLGPGRPVTDTWSKPNGNLVCCYGTGLESHAKYADSIYFHDGRNGLFVNLFIASELDWRERGMRVRQETRYPEESVSRFTMSCREPVSIRVNIRHPWWAESGFQIRVNGQEQSVQSVSGGYATLERTWKEGDTVEVLMPTNLRMEGFRDNPKRVAVMYGPLVMAAETELHNRFAAIVSDDGNGLKAVKPIEGKILEFAASPAVFRTSPLVCSTEPVIFKPLSGFLDQSKVVYWDVNSAQAFERYPESLRSEQKRIEALEAETVDWVLCPVSRKEFQREGKYSVQGYLLGLAGNNRMIPRTFEQVSEETHKMEITAKTGTWYAPTDFFVDGIPCHFRFVHSYTVSYEMRVLPDQEQTLQVRLWRPAHAQAQWLVKPVGSFEVLVDGQVIGGSKAESLPPEEFVNLALTIPSNLTKGKESVKVAFRTVSGSALSRVGFYECRIVRKRQ